MVHGLMARLQCDDLSQHYMQCFKPPGWFIIVRTCYRTALTRQENSVLSKKCSSGRTSTSTHAGVDNLRRREL